jgi:hypothetical protein
MYDIHFPEILASFTGGFLADMMLFPFKNRITIFYKGKHYAWKTWQTYEKITQLRSRIDGKVIPVIFYCQNL